MKKLKTKSSYIKDNDIVVQHDVFVYEVEIYVITKNRSYLKDTKLISLINYKTDEPVYIHKSTHTIKCCFSLIAAPISWLESNGFRLRA